MPWKAIACSATGTSHEKTGKPCQDYADFIRVNDSGDVDKNGEIAIGAVCDGAGSCKHSDIGSQLAVQTTLKSLQSWLQCLKQEKKDLSQAISEDDAHKVFANNLAKVKEAFNKEAQAKNCLPKDLSCTLLVVVATPQWLAAMQIGDGFIVIRQPDSEYQLLFQSQKGEYANQTTFVTASNALEKMESKVVPGQQQFIFASTDGLERLALEIRQVSNPYPPFFETFREAIETRSEDEEKISTQEWLNSDKVNKRTDDDKTILLCWYESGQGAIGKRKGNTAGAPRGTLITSGASRQQSAATKQSKISALKKYSESPAVSAKNNSTLNNTSVKSASEAQATSDSSMLEGSSSEPNPNRSPRTPLKKGGTGADTPTQETEESQTSGESKLKNSKLRAEYREYSSLIERYTLGFNILAGIFWNSLYHDLVAQIKFNSELFRNIAGICIAVTLAALILLVNVHFWQRYIRLSSSENRKSKIGKILLIFAYGLVGLGMGGGLYYGVYIYLLNTSNL